MKILSGKKLRLVIFGLLVIAVLGFLVSQPNRSHYEDKEILSIGNSGKVIQISARSQITKRDSDKDGLKDWEEELWGTNPNNPDTDEDGTNDGDEVDDNRNPTVAGPDDVFQGDIFIKQSSSDFSSGGLTETEKFSQEFFAEYLSLKQSGVDLNEQEVQDFLINSTFEKAQVEIKKDSYTPTDLNIIQDDSVDAIKKYGNEMGNIIITYSIESENEAVILKRALENNDKEEIKKLEPIITAYKNHLDKFLNVPVPQSATITHLKIINSFSLIASTIEGMRAVFSDPLIALNSVAVYQDNAQELGDSFLGSNEYFKIKDISFDKNEAGYVFTHLII